MNFFLFQKVSSFFKNNQRVVLSFLIFILVFFILGIPFTKWGFMSDDAANILHSKGKSWDHLFRFFYEESVEGFLFHPSNLQFFSRNFFAAIYRPLIWVYFMIQSFFFGTSAYGYFLVTVSFHALNSVILFNIFLFFVDYWLSFVGALFFAFHSSIHNWFCWISTQHYHIELTWILLFILTFKKYLDSRIFLYYLISCFFLLLALFTREGAIVVPVWTVFAVCFYLRYVIKLSGSWFTVLLCSLKLSIGYWVVTFFYLIVRVLVFPITSNTAHLCFEPTLHSFISRLFSRFWDLVSYVSDTLGLVWLPPNNRLLKGSILVLVALAFLWIFFKNTQKKGLLFLGISLLLFSWIPFITQYRIRYVYLILPFAIAIILWNISFYNGKCKIRKISMCVLGFLVIFNGLFLFSKMKKREHVLNIFHNAVCNFVRKPEIKNKPLFFMGLPKGWLWGVAQYIWLYAGEPFHPIYCEVPTFVDVGFFDWRFAKKSCLKIKPIFKGFRFKFLDTNKLFFKGSEKGQSGTSTGKVIVHSIEKGNRICDMSLVISDKYLNQKPLFVTWDYAKLRFKILPFPPT